MTGGELQTAAAELVLDRLGTEQLRAVAITAISNGAMSPALGALAGLADPQARDARALFEQAMGELNDRMPSQAPSR